jgi:hypothetical protein
MHELAVFNRSWTSAKPEFSPTLLSLLASRSFGYPFH